MERPTKTFYLGYCPLIVAALVALPFLNNFMHGLDGDPEPIAIEQLEAGGAPNKHFVRVTGYVDPNGIVIETRSARGGRTTDAYFPVRSGPEATAPIAAMLDPEFLSTEELDSLAGRRLTFDAVVRDRLWEGLSDGDVEIFREHLGPLALSPLLLGATTPEALLTRGLAVVGGTWVLMLLMMAYCYRYNLRQYERRSRRAAAPQPALERAHV